MVIHHAAPPAPPAALSPAAPPVAAGECTFRMYLPQARRVQLLGGFTGWRERPIDLIREKAGWWFVTLNIPAGEHQFSYLVDECSWVADYAASGIHPNGYGGYNSCLRVETRADTHAPLANPALRLAA